LRARTPADVILLTPNFMAAHDNPRISDRHRQFADTIIGRQNDGTLKSYVDALRDLARALDVPVADVYAEWEKMAAAGLDFTARLSNGLNHPTPPASA